MLCDGTSESSSSDSEGPQPLPANVAREESWDIEKQPEPRLRCRPQIWSHSDFSVLTVQHRATLAVRPRLAQTRPFIRRFPLPDDSRLFHRETVASELESPAEVNVLAYQETLSKSRNSLKCLSTDGQVRTQSERQKSHLARGGGDGRTLGSPVDRAEVVHARHHVIVSQSGDDLVQPVGPDDVVGVTKDQQGTFRSTDAGISRRAWTDGMRRVDQPDMRILFRPTLDAHARSVLRAVVGYHEFPLGRKLLVGDSMQLFVQPRHAVADRNDHADHGKPRSARRIDVVEVIHGRRQPTETGQLT